MRIIADRIRIASYLYWPLAASAYCAI